MARTRLNSSKLVYPASLSLYRLVREFGLPHQWQDNIGDADYSAIISGRTGSGKDVLTMYFMMVDLMHGRTPIILDTKMEYPLNIFCQIDRVLRNVLVGQGLVGRGFTVNLWVPYTQGMSTNRHFLQLLQYKHPNLKIRPFRIYTPDLISEDSANMAMSKSQLQSMADKNMDLKGQSGQLNELREYMAKVKMGFDEEDMRTPGCGWEYINFDRMASNHTINVISTFYLRSKNLVAGTSFMIGMIQELLTVAKCSHRQRGNNEMFTLIVPEIQLILNKQVKSLKESASTLGYTILDGLLLMRQFGTRLRINLQNLSFLEASMLSQSEIFIGRTQNHKDLSILSRLGINRYDQRKMTGLKKGHFVHIRKKELFSAVPFSHKAREKESLLGALHHYQTRPSDFLFETKDSFLTEIVNYRDMFGKRPMTVREYEYRVNKWLREQKPKSVCEIPEASTPVVENFDHTFQKAKGVAH